MAPYTTRNTTTASTVPTKTSTCTTSHDAIVDFFLDQLATIQSRFDEPELDKFGSEGKPRLAKSVRFFLDRAEPIQLVLPAFPFKSPNKGGKVLGALPDRGEELALLRLEQFCQTIETVYPTGCTVTIFSDGRVFNDLLGVSTEAMAAYKVELRAMAADAGHTHINFDGLEHHTTTSDPIKEVLDRFHVGEMDMNALIKQDAGLLNTYRSFRKFLEKDLAHKWKTMSNNQASKQIGDIAKQMMHRNVGFSTLVDVTYPHAVRLSIHLYDNAGPKFGIHLTPHTASNVSKPRTPWHSVICEDLDGSVHKLDLDSVDMAKYELVEKRGRPWGFRERAVATPTATAATTASDVTTTTTATTTAKATTKSKSAVLEQEKQAWSHLDVDLIEEPLLLIIQARASSTPSMLDVPVASLRTLTCSHGVVSLRGFKQDDDMVQVAERLGPVLEWSWGKVFEIKSVSDTTLTGQTLEAMAMHYDGMFKKKHADSTELGDVWLYQLFHCLEAYPTNEQQQQDNANEDLREGTSGRTLFTHTAPLLDDLTEQERERLRETTLVYNTGLFDQAHLTHASPVVITHPVTGNEVLRYHEPWGPERTKMFTTTVTTQGVDTAKVLSGEIKDETADWVASLLVDKLYDPKYCYAHAWSKGEFVIADNVSLIHARTAMKADGRHVRRIHIN